MINLMFIFITFSESFSRFWQMKQAAFLSGVDAYYYALQIRFFGETGALKIPDSSPLLLLMGWTAKFGLSYEHTIILWNVLIQLACGISVFIAYRLIQRKNLASVLPLLLTWTVLSPALAFTCIEFPKYAFSLIFLPFWPVGLINRRLWPLSLAAVILSCTSHLAMIGLFVLVLFGLILAVIFRLKRPHEYFSYFKKPVVVIGIVVLILVFILILGKFFLVADLNRINFKGLQPSIWTFFSRRALPLLLKAEVAVSGIISLIISICAFQNKTKIIGRFWSPFILLLSFIPLGSAEVMGLPERLCLILPFVTICSLMDFQKKFSVLVKALSYSFIGLTLVLVALFPKSYLDWVHPDHLNPDYQLYDQVTKAIARRDIPMLIAHQGLNYYYKYKTMKESFPYEPESHWPKQKIWRIVYGVTPSQWAYYLPEKYLWGSGLLFSLPGPYSLIREDCWDQFRDEVKAAQDGELKELTLNSWLNPSQPRPEFARKRSERVDDGKFSAYPGKSDLRQ